MQRKLIGLMLSGLTFVSPAVIACRDKPPGGRRGTRPPEESNPRVLCRSWGATRFDTTGLAL